MSTPRDSSTWASTKWPMRHFAMTGMVTASMISSHLDRVGHAGHPALGPDVRRDALQRHDRHRARFLGDSGLLGVGDVHDHPSLLHLGESSLDQLGPVAQLGQVQFEYHLSHQVGLV